MPMDSKLNPLYQKLLFVFCTAFWITNTFSLSLSEITFGIAIFIWVLDRWKSGQLKQSLRSMGATPVGKCALLLITWTVLSLFWSEHPQQSVRGIFKVLSQVIIFALAAQAFTETRSLRLWEKLFIFWSGFVILNGIFQYFYGFDVLRHITPQQSGAGLRLSSSFKNYGLFGCYLILSIPYVTGLMITYWKNADKRMVLLSAAVLVGNLVMLFLTRSRGAMLALILTMLFALLLKRKFIWLSIAGTVLIITVLFVLPKNVVLHLDSEMKEQSLVERIYLWQRAADVIKVKPLTGTGINTYTRSHMKYDRTQNWRVQGYYAHNGYLQMAAETGIPGLLLFLTFLFYVVQNLVRHLKNGLSPAHQTAVQFLLLGCLNFLVLAFVDTVMHNDTPVMHFWFQLGLISAYLKQAGLSQTPTEKAA